MKVKPTGCPATLDVEDERKGVKNDSEVFGIGSKMDAVAVAETAKDCRRSTLGWGLHGWRRWCFMDGI